MAVDERAMELLLRSFDSGLDRRDREYLEKALEESEELRAEKVSLESMRTQIGDAASDSFGPFFADRVMNAIESTERADASEEWFGALVALFRPVLAVSAIAIAVLVPFNLYRMNGTTGADTESIVYAIEKANALSLEDEL
jgi:hypothetical protein